jgi:D-alanyl-D-alanine carboxypeptidase
VLADILGGGVMRILALPLMLGALHATPAKPPLFHGSVAPLPAPLNAALAKHLWHRGCPVPRSQLRLLTVSYVGFDRQPHSGELVVNADAARPLVKVFRRLYELRFRIREMRALADSGDDTAAFECRDAVSSPCPGTPPSHSWSEHAYGEAVDINPIENPYTGCGRTREKASIPYLNRSQHRPGMVTAAVVQAFASIGWGWGGSWSGTKDYMHFSATGH